MKEKEMVLDSGKRIVHIEKRKLQKIAVTAIQSLHTMLAQDGGEMCIRYQVAAGRNFCGQFPVNIPEPFLL